MPTGNPGVDAATVVALAYQRATATIIGRLSLVLASLWHGVDVRDAPATWAQVLPQAVGAFSAAQDAAAGMADSYAGRALAAQAPGLSAQVRASAARELATAGRAAAARVLSDAGVEPSALSQLTDLSVDPTAFSGVTASGLSLEDLLSIPAQRAGAAIAAGAQAADVARAGQASLTMYATTEVADAARSAASVASVTRGSAGYIREVGPFCCSRCALLSGRFYRHSSGFLRHPGCRCQMRPCTEAPEDIPSPIDLYRQGRITDLTRAEREALDLGADISQVINAKKGLYIAGGQQYTTVGTTTRGLAGARILARDIARAQGAPAGRTYANYAISRQQVAQATARYGPMMRAGLPFRRSTPLGGETTSAYRLTRTARPSVATILRTSTSQDDSVRMLINNGYLIRPQDAATSTHALERMLRTG